MEIRSKALEGGRKGGGWPVLQTDSCLFLSVLCFQVIEITEYRTQLYEYIKNRMVAIAPNLTVLVGELVGARLISHAGKIFWFLP